MGWGRSKSKKKKNCMRYAEFVREGKKKGAPPIRISLNTNGSREGERKKKLQWIGGKRNFWPIADVGYPDKQHC